MRQNFRPRVPDKVTFKGSVTGSVRAPPKRDSYDFRFNVQPFLEFLLGVLGSSPEIPSLKP